MHKDIEKSLIYLTDVVYVEIEFVNQLRKRIPALFGWTAVSGSLCFSDRWLFY